MRLFIAAIHTPSTKSQEESLEEALEKLAILVGAEDIDDITTKLKVSILTASLVYIASDSMLDMANVQGIRKLCVILGLTSSLASPLRIAMSRGGGYPSRLFKSAKSTSMLRSRPRPLRLNVFTSN